MQIEKNDENSTTDKTLWTVQTKAMLTPPSKHQHTVVSGSVLTLLAFNQAVQTILTSFYQILLK